MIFRNILINNQIIPEFCAGFCYDCIMKIEMLLQEQVGFTANEKAIANYILSHKDDVLQMSVQALAKETFTSTSAVMRLCSRMKLSGYRDLKFRLSEELLRPENEEQEIDPNFPFSKNDSVPEIARQILQPTIQTIRETQTMLSVKDMKRACYLLKQADNVALFGVGDAYLAGLAFQASMTRAGINYIGTPVYGEQGHLVRTLHPSDCALLLSYSGSTRSTIEYARQLRRQKVPTICITANARSELARICDIALFLPAKEEKGLRIAAFFSRASMEYYLNIMYSYLYVLDYDRHVHNTID